MDNKNKEKPWWQPAIFMFLRLSGWIAIPVLIGGGIGKWLDEKYDTEPWLFLGSIGTAFLISMFGLVKNTMEEYRKIEKESKKDKKEN